MNRLSSRFLIALASGIAVIAVAVVAVTRIGVFAPTPVTHQRIGLFDVSLVAPASADDATISSLSASAIAVTAVASSPGPTIVGYSTTAGRMVSGVTSVSNARHSIVFTTNKPLAACWVFDLEAPSQSGFAHNEALVIVNATTGKVVSIQRSGWK